MSRKELLLYLLPPAAGRLESLDAIMEKQPNPRRYLFYGLDFFKSRGVEVRHNLKPSGTVSHHLSWMNQRILSTVGTPAGDLSWLLPVWIDFYSCSCIIAYSDRIILALCQLRILGLIPRVPTLYIPMGLPEKLASFQNRPLLHLVLGELRRLECIASLSMSECERLASEYGLVNVRFTTTGVDTDYFVPLDMEPDVDVISIGADPFRDFETLLAAAACLPECSFRLITRRRAVEQFGAIPRNVEMLFDVPMETVPHYLASGRMTVLPVQDNSYSGATTVLLQAMSMGRAVIANPCGANRSGYGFEDRVNCRMVPPQDVDQLVGAIRELNDSPEKRIQLGRAARAHVANHLTLERFHGKLYDMMRDLLASSRNKS